MSETPNEVEILIRAFNRSRSLYETLVQEVRFALEAAIANLDVHIAGMSGRAKTVDSLQEKLRRKGYRTSDDIPDLAGVRVVTLFEPDTQQILAIIRQNFVVIEDHPPDETLGVDRMGYNAHHLVVMLGSQAYAGPRYDGVRNLKCEVQVRTAIQDAWALVSHNLVYKQEKAIPPIVRRQLNKVSAILEIAQDVFESVRQSREQYVKEIETQAQDPEAFLDLPINADTLISYTRKTFPELPVSESLLALLLRDLDLETYRTLGDIDRVVQAALPNLRAYAAAEPTLFRFGTDYLTKALGLRDRSFRARHPFGRKSREYFEALDRAAT